jgi:hypothetical protein
MSYSTPKKSTRSGGGFNYEGKNQGRMTNDQIPMTNEDLSALAVGHWCLVIGHSIVLESRSWPSVSQIAVVRGRHPAG